MNNKFGDFQTPLELAKQCMQKLTIPEESRILEPTCGTGAFLHAAMDLYPKTERRGVEINKEYAKQASSFGSVANADVFTYDFTGLQWKKKGRIYVVGNPPWVTAADMKRMGSTNIPTKSNFKEAQGFDAILGGSNFDICESIILQMIHTFGNEPMTLGMLCKTQVVRNMMEYAEKHNLPIGNARIFRIDARKWFNVDVDACLFIMDGDPSTTGDYRCREYGNLDATEPLKTFGCVSGRLVSDMEAYEANKDIDSISPMQWRSGIKHDASKVYELEESDGKIISAEGDVFEQSDETIYPLMKSSDLAKGRRDSGRWMIVPQKKLGADTETLKETSPKTWEYLDRHAETLDNRQSNIYMGKPRFSVFGIGDYTFAPYKVAISGLYKEPAFQLIGMKNGKPVVFDDTCYMLPFETTETAAVVWAMLEGRECADLINALYFKDAKRPITKRLLQRIDFSKTKEDSEAILNRARIETERLGLPFDPRKAKDSIESIQQRNVPALSG